ncbi:MAG: phosphotransferase family protein [Betaproteobacteria bacterium]|nr:phosphotransferase family protein [Betaproteobacteria bacterium]
MTTSDSTTSARPGTARSVEEAKGALECFIARESRCRKATITGLVRLSGGAIQENWALDVLIEGGPRAGVQQWVLRTDAQSTVAESLTRPQEFAVLKAVHEAGARVPEPLWLCRDREVLGKDFYLMQRVAGVAAGHRVVKDPGLGGDRVRLLEDLGESLAHLHSLTPGHPGLEFLMHPGTAPALTCVADYRRHLDAARDPHPVLEWGLAFCERHGPAEEAVTLIHRDFRTGNYMVDGEGLAGILDWEFTAFGDPLEDIGWFCAKCWCFGQYARGAGGIGPRGHFYRAYERVSGRGVDPHWVTYWEIMAHLRWAVIALQQGERHLSGEEPSLELALTGRIPAGLELETLRLARLFEEGR